jgi:Mimiviridae putative endonuclease 4
MADNGTEYRVRQVIKRLKYASLVKRGLVPDLDPHFQVGTKRYPTWIYKLSKGGFSDIFSCIGWYLDGLVRKMLSEVTEVNWGNCGPGDLTSEMRSPDQTWQSIAYPYLKRVFKFYESSGCPEKDVFNKWFPFLGKLNKELKLLYEPMITEREIIYFNTEFSVARNGVTISGHPDIVTDLCVVDIKTSSGFKKMAHQSYLQVLAYVALMRASTSSSSQLFDKRSTFKGRDINHLGILLSMHCEQIIVNLDDWNSGPFLDEMFESLRKTNGASIPMHISIPPNVGLTIGKGKSDWPTRLTSYVQQYGPRPCQILFSGRFKAVSACSDRELAAINQFLEITGLPLYSHGPYTINLSKGWPKADPNDKRWAINRCIGALRNAHSAGIRGVVIHTGKHVELPYQEGYDRLIAGLKETLQYASEECPLILETPAGQGTEIGIAVDEFSGIYDHFNSEERKRLKICIDTCHVWAAGHHPLEYLKRWEELQTTKDVALIHFNDSRDERGSMKDRHMPYGCGQIGKTALDEVMHWCLDRGLHMVME